MASTSTLTANDTRILNALFDPETLPSSVANSRNPSIDENLPPHPRLSSSQITALENQQIELIQQVNADPSLLDEVMKQMDDIITRYPSYGSAFANRAMLRRMKLESKHSQSIFEDSEDEIETLFRDLSHAIYTSSAQDSPSAPVSSFQARVLRIAHSHRAYLYLKAVESGFDLNGKGRSELEELASIDFTAAATYGDHVAREMSVRTNPYAKMCGSIVKNALAEERKISAMRII